MPRPQDGAWYYLLPLLVSALVLVAAAGLVLALFYSCRVLRRRQQSRKRRGAPQIQSDGSRVFAWELVTDDDEEEETALTRGGVGGWPAAPPDVGAGGATDDDDGGAASRPAVIDVEPARTPVPTFAEEAEHSDEEERVAAALHAERSARARLQRLWHRMWFGVQHPQRAGQTYAADGTLVLQRVQRMGLPARAAPVDDAELDDRLRTAALSDALLRDVDIIGPPPAVAPYSRPLPSVGASSRE